MERLTPLLYQYKKIKEKYKDYILLFRMGDFYEMFYDDAVEGSKILNITLTSRNYGETRVPLAGIPVKSVDSYLKKLINSGRKIAICEQVEEAGKGKKLVKREVVEVITPGTITREDLLPDTEVYIGAVFPGKNRIYGISFCDVSTGEFYTFESEISVVKEEIKKMNLKEMIFPEDYSVEELELEDTFKTPLPFYYFQFSTAYSYLLSHFGVKNLEGFGIEHKRNAIVSSGALLKYIGENQKNLVPQIRKISLHTPEHFMYMDSSSIRNLELIRRITGEEENSLFHIMNLTETPSGKRLLKKWLLRPLIEKDSIEKRLDGVEELIKRSQERKKLKELLKGMGDHERLITKIVSEKASPRDILRLRSIIERSVEIKKILGDFKSGIIKEIERNIIDKRELAERIKRTIRDDAPLQIGEGEIIKEGVSPELDEIKSIAKNAREYILKLEEEEKKKTGIPKLRIKFNSVFGYYIEITKSYIHMVPERYFRKQTLTNTERYYTKELKELEDRILGAEEKIKSMEKELFISFRRDMAQERDALYSISSSLSQIDVLLSFATLSHENDYTRPEIEEDSVIKIRDGRHPVVEKLIDTLFIPNDTYLDKKTHKVLIITGPNMSGKSTYLRQVALITIMAQMGCFVPASYARIGIVDRIFTRIGASDDLSRGVSTFLAEMTETANILNNMTERSLLIMDEIGRGTSTYDGLSIAWAVLEYIYKHRTSPRTLFATHYHEITKLSEVYPGIKNYNFSAKETDTGIVFIRKLREGPAEKSYGIEVASFAGIPDKVIERAKEILYELEEKGEEEISDIYRGRRQQLVLFDMRPPEMLEELKKIDPNRITPLEALNIIAKWKKKYTEK